MLHILIVCAKVTIKVNKLVRTIFSFSYVILFFFKSEIPLNCCYRINKTIFNIPIQLSSNLNNSETLTNASLNAEPNIRFVWISFSLFAIFVNLSSSSYYRFLGFRCDGPVYLFENQRSTVSLKLENYNFKLDN